MGAARQAIYMDNFTKNTNDRKDETRLTSPSPPPITHDTSRASYHISDIGSFATDLQNVPHPSLPPNTSTDLQRLQIEHFQTEDDHATEPSTYALSVGRKTISKSKTR